MGAFNWFYQCKFVFPTGICAPYVLFRLSFHLSAYFLLANSLFVWLLVHINEMCLCFNVELHCMPLNECHRDCCNKWINGNTARSSDSASVWFPGCVAVLLWEMHLRLEKSNQSKAFVKDLRLGVVRHGHAEAASSIYLAGCQSIVTFQPFPQKVNPRVQATQDLTHMNSSNDSLLRCLSPPLSRRLYPVVSRTDARREPHIPLWSSLSFWPLLSHLSIYFSACLFTDKRLIFALVLFICSIFCLLLKWF